MSQKSEDPIGLDQFEHDISSLISVKAEESIIEKERQIFLRALLQLLDERDSSIDARRSSKGEKEKGNDPNIIKAGSLKKASGNSLYLWKEKYVELRHGVFSYEDDIGWGEVHRKKTILLTADKCRCRPHILQSSHGGSWVFEISMNNNRRLWMASSVDERDAWVLAINTATLGSAGDFNMDNSSQLQLLATPHLQQQGSGAVAPYATEINVYNRMRAELKKVKSTIEYRAILSKLSTEQLTLPVFYIKVYY